jgi:hypothetical protein
MVRDVARGYYALRNGFATGLGARSENLVNRNAHGRCEYR